MIYKIIQSFLCVLLVSTAGAVSFGNPADIPHRKSLSVSAEYSRQFLYTSSASYSNTIISQRLMMRMGYTFFKWLEVYALAGGCDGDLSWGYPSAGVSIDLNGSWELSPGVGIRLKPNIKFNSLGMKWHLLFEGRYIFIRSRQQKFIVPAGTSIEGMVTLNEFEASGLVSGYYRKLDLAFYAGLAMKSIWSEFAVGNEKVFLGASMSVNELFFPHMVFPFFGINWNLGNNYVVCFEGNLADWKELGSLNPKFGFSIGISQYR